MLHFKFLVLIQLFAIAFAFDSSVFEVNPEWGSVRSTIDTGFSCEGRPYGYYADVANDCQLYHVCNPREIDGRTVYSHDPFICPLGTVFDQQLLTCVHSTAEFSCPDQSRYYESSNNQINTGSQPIVHQPVVVSSPVVPAVANVVTPVVSERPVVRESPAVTEDSAEVSNEQPLNDTVSNDQSSSQQQQQQQQQQQTQEPSKGPSKGGQQQQQTQEPQPSKGPSKGGQQQQQQQTQEPQPSKGPSKGGQQQQQTQEPQPSKGPSKGPSKSPSKGPSKGGVCKGC